MDKMNDGKKLTHRERELFRSEMAMAACVKRRKWMEWQRKRKEWARKCKRTKERSLDIKNLLSQRAYKHEVEVCNEHPDTCSCMQTQRARFQKWFICSDKLIEIMFQILSFMCVCAFWHRDSTSTNQPLPLLLSLEIAFNSLLICWCNKIAEAKQK